MLPSEALIADRLARVDPDAVGKAREELRACIGRTLEQDWRELYARHRADAFEYSPDAKGARRLRNVALAYLDGSGAGDAATLAYAQFRDSDNMTDRLAALATLANGHSAERERALQEFYARYRDNALVIDKWFTAQALSTRDDTVEAVAALTRHADFTLKNPNRFRSLIGTFSVNQRALHRADGAGYALLAEQIIALDAVNPQTAAKMVPPLGRWRRFDEARQACMRHALQSLIDRPGLSKDVYEQASKSLA